MDRRVGYRGCSDHDHLLRFGQTVAPRYCILKAFRCIFRKKSYVSLVLKMSPNFQGCRDICPHFLATLAEHWIQAPRALLLAHLSRRLMGELIVYQSLLRPSVVRPSRISNIFSETTRPIKFKFHMETSMDAGKKFVQMVLVT